MADQRFLTQAGAFVMATARQTALAASVLHLFKSDFTPDPSTTLVDLLANECDFDGYLPLTIAAWEDPALAPGSGWMIFAPAQTFRWTFDTDSIQNSVGGTFLVDSNGDLADVVVYETPKPMQGPGQIVQEIPVEIFSASPS